MGTKWKKSKAAASFLAFFLGVNLLLAGAFGSMATLWNERGQLRGWELRDAFAADFQETAAFRSCVTSYLDLFRGLVRNEKGTMPISNNGIPMYWAETTALLAEDRNVLYYVYDTGFVYKNAETADWVGTPGKLPPGYNLLLDYNGWSVRIWKDGQPVDIYGDGFYYGGYDQWYLPGYSNTAARDGDIRICLAVSESPVYYSTADNANWLVHEKNELLTLRYLFIGVAAALAAGAVLFIAYLVSRQAKRRVDLAIARLSGCVWVEVKLAALLLLGGILIYIWQSAPFTHILRYCIGYPMGCLETFLTVAAFFWCFYLLINDMSYNRKPWKRSLIWSLWNRLGPPMERATRRLRASVKNSFSRYRVGVIKLPIQKRYTRRGILVLVGTLPLAALAGLFFLRFFGASHSLGFAELLLVFGFSSVPVLVLLLPLAFYVKKNQDLVLDVGALMDHIAAVGSGSLTEHLTLPKDSDLKAAATSLNGIQRGMLQALAEQTRSERMKVELITNVSHDIKTPLTAIISYVELLKEEESLPEHVKDYVAVLDNKAQRLKTMVQDVFEVSKAASGDLPLRVETLDYGKLLRQTLADMDERVGASGLTLKTALPEVPVYISADGARMYRVFQNLVQNALNYSLPGSRVYVTLVSDGGRASASVKNTSKTELPVGVDWTERFIRGDESRTEGGSGLGLAIASSFTATCGGKFRVKTDADLFSVEVEFPVTQTEPLAPELCELS